MPDCGMRRFEDGGVVQPQPAWRRIWDMLMAKDALKKATGEAPPPMQQPQNTDYVRKAAEEAGRRNDEEQRKQTQYGGYGR